MPEFRYIVDTDRYDEMVAFYRDGCGFPVSHDWEVSEIETYRGSVLSAADGFVEIREREPGVLIGVETDDVDAQHERLQAAGAAILLAPVTMPWGHRHFAVLDPDGNRVAFFQKVDQTG